MTADSYIRELTADRLGGSGFFTNETVYKFEKIKRAKREAVRNNPGVPLIDMGVGEPHMMADQAVIEALYKEAMDWENRGYADNGILDLKNAAADYMGTFFGVDVDPGSEIIHAIGAKNALAFLPLGFVNPGDHVIMTIPGYAVMGIVSKWLGGNIYDAELRRGKRFLPDLDSIPAEILDNTKLFCVNYPNNPTGAQATRAFYENLVAKAKKHKFAVVQDAAYSLLVYDDRPLSFLSVDGAKDVGVEIHSVSKGYNMTGWRLAFAAGNEDIIKILGNVKDNLDSGQFKAIQKAVAYAALPDAGIPTATVQEYSRRLNLMVGSLRVVGFDARKPAGTFFLYVPAPKGAKDTEFRTAADASQYLIKNCLISTVPWDDIPGEPHLRFSATFETLRGNTDGMSEDEKTAAEIETLEEMVNRLSKIGLVF